MRKIIVALLILICFKSQAQITVASGFNVAAQQSADSKQYKLVNGKHVPYVSTVEYLALVPPTRRHIGQIGYIGSLGDTIFVFQFIGGITDNSFIQISSSKGSSGGVTNYAIQTATGGITTFTFANVPSAYADYTIAANGVIMRAGIDFTQLVNTITIPTITDGEYVEYRRIK